MDETIFIGEEGPLICVCGDPDDHHVDGTEQCFIPDCGCREFEEADILSDMSGATEGER